MGIWIQNELGNDVWSRALVVLIDAGVKGILLLMLVGLVVLIMQRASAAARHLVWTLALVGLLVLPVVSLVVPKWQLPILPAKEVPVAQTMPLTPMPVQEPSHDEHPVAGESPIPLETRQEVDRPIATSASWFATQPMAFWMLLGWIAGVTLVLMPLLVGFAVVARTRRKSSPFQNEELSTVAGTLAELLRLSRPVTIRCAGPTTMPMATGLLRPTLFLPRESEEWPEEKRRVVLLHELAHVKRRDCLTHAVARVATALHWFNPLAWVALRRLRIEREQACDDLVLATGERPSAYADYLLDIARTMRAGALTSVAAITMATKGQLEGRLLAVLDPRRNRRVVTRAMLALGVVLTCLIALPLAAVNVAQKEVPNAISEVRCEGSRATIKYESDKAHEIFVSVGNESYGWWAFPGALSGTATVEASDQIKMDNGSFGRGFTVRVKSAGIEGCAFAAITPDGKIPFGDLVFRENANVTEKDGAFTFADIHQANGTTVPIFARVRRAKKDSGTSMVAEQKTVAVKVESVNAEIPKTPNTSVTVTDNAPKPGSVVQIETKAIPVGNIEICSWRHIVNSGQYETSKKETSTPFFWVEPSTGKVWKNLYHSGPPWRSFNQLPTGIYRMSVHAVHQGTQNDPTPFGFTNPITLAMGQDVPKVTVQYLPGVRTELHFVDATTNKPVSGVDFLLKNADGFPVGHVSLDFHLNTGESNTVTFSALPPGKYVLTASTTPRRPDEPQYALREDPTTFEVREEGQQVAIAMTSKNMTEEEIAARWPFVVFGAVTDQDGSTVPDVEVRASCGIGSCLPTGSTVSGKDGSYKLRFGPGWVTDKAETTGSRRQREFTPNYVSGLYSGPDAADGLRFVPGIRTQNEDATWERVVHQAALVHAVKKGYYEQNSCRQGNLTMAGERPPKENNLGSNPDEVVLPNQPYRVDFVMTPGCTVNGTLLDTAGQPVAGKKITVAGPEMLPGANVFSEPVTDKDGHFMLSDIPCKKFWFEVDKVRCEPVDFARPGDYTLGLRLSTKEGKTVLEVECVEIRKLVDEQGPSSPVAVKSGNASLTPGSVFEKMRSMDAIYARALSVEGTCLNRRDPYTPESTEYKIAFSFSQAGNRTAYRFAALEPPAVQEGNVTKLAPTVVDWIYVGPNKYAETMLGAITNLSNLDIETLKIASGKVSPVISQRPPNPKHRTLNVEETERALGRGYTRYATECIKVIPLPAGLLEVHLRTQESGGGQWELIVDPTRDYLVRKGKLVRELNGQVIVEVDIETEGFLMGDPDVSVASKASVKDRVFIGENRIQFTSVHLLTNEALFTDTNKHTEPDAFPLLTTNRIDEREPGATKMYLKRNESK